MARHNARQPLPSGDSGVVPTQGSSTAAPAAVPISRTSWPAGRRAAGWLVGVPPYDLHHGADARGRLSTHEPSGQCLVVEWMISSTGADVTISVGDDDSAYQVAKMYTWFGLNRPRQGRPEPPDGQGQERQRQGQVLQDRAQPWELPASG